MKKTQRAVRPKPVKMWAVWHKDGSTPDFMHRSRRAVQSCIDDDIDMSRRCGYRERLAYMKGCEAVQVTITRAVRGKTTNKRKES